jgi:hypothetical protein
MRAAPTDTIAPPRSVARVEMRDCTLDEPMVLSLRLLKDGKWAKSERVFPTWKDAIKAAYIVCCRLDPKSAESDCYYMQDFKNGSYAPELPWWVRADANSSLFIWPRRVYDDYIRRLGEGTAYPIKGDEHLLKLPDENK